MTERPVVLVERDPRRRPQASWRDAWADSKGDALSTLSTWSYMRDAMRFGGWRAVIAPTLACGLLTALFISGALAAAVIAGSADGATARATLVIGASVVLSQVMTAIQNRRPARRLFIVASLRVSEQPAGWGVASIDVPADGVARARDALLRADFSYVEVTYYRGTTAASIAAYYELTKHREHALILVARALGAIPHTVTTVTLVPSKAT
jgi:hypothetical protein